MTMRGSFREIVPAGRQVVEVRVLEAPRARRVRLLERDTTVAANLHEGVAIDLG